MVIPQPASMRSARQPTINNGIAQRISGLGREPRGVDCGACSIFFMRVIVSGWQPIDKDAWEVLRKCSARRIIQTADEAVTAASVASTVASAGGAAVRRRLATGCVSGTSNQK